MKINKLTLYLCFLAPTAYLHSGTVSADCNTPISASDVPAFIAADQVDGYLADARERQQALCSSDKGIFGKSKAIYVTDNRYDAYLAKGAVREAARSTAALISTEHLRRQGNEYVINHNMTLQQTGWCASEPFASQPVTSTCTAFLVADNTLVTAGHCLRDSQGNNIPLNSYYVVFGFQMNSKNQAQTRFPARDVYRMSRELEVKKNLSEDWAVVELDRRVTNRKVFEFEADEVAEGTPLVIFGYPNGLPLKIAGGGTVKRNDYQQNVFDTDLDSYRGNSGSPVLNAQALKQGRFVVEGILVSGATDSRPSGKCKVSITCESAQLDNRTGHCSGEKVTKINRVVAGGSSSSQTPPAPGRAPDRNNSGSDFGNVTDLFQ